MSFFHFTNDAFEDVLRLQRAIDRAVGRPFFGLDWTPSGRGLFPSLNVFEADDALIVKAEVPGLAKEDLAVEIEDNRLMLSGKRPAVSLPEGGAYHRRERATGEFRRAFRLPFEVDREKTAASYHDGVLTIRLEKAAAAKPRQIPVSV